MLTGLSGARSRLRAIVYAITAKVSVGHRYAIIPLLYALATAAMLWPLVTHIRSAVADSESDPLLNAWALRWVQHALVTDPLNLYNANQLAPNLHSLAFSEALLPQAVMAWPLWIFSHDAIFSHNAILLLTYPLCATAMYALCRSLGAMRGAAFVAGLCYTFAPFRMDNNSHLQVLSMQWMPLAILAVIRFVQRPTRWRGAAVVAALLLSALSSVYYLVIFGTGLAVFLLVELVRQRRAFISRTGLRLAVALALTALLLVPFSLPYLQMQREQRITRTLDEAYGNAARADSYMTVTTGSLLWRHVLPTSGLAHSGLAYGPLFPGLVVVVLALFGLAHVRRPWMAGALALGLAGLVLSFGPTWSVKDAGHPLPYRFLYTHVFGYQGLRGPDRFTVLVLLALCVYAAAGATWLVERAQQRAAPLARAGLLVTAIVAGGVLLDDGTRLSPVVPVDRSAATLAPYRWLAAQSDTGIVAEFPIRTMQTRTAFYSTYHWRPVLWGHSGLTPQAHYELAKRLVGEGDAIGTADLDMLRDMGVGTLLIHQSAYSADAFDRIRGALATAPVRVRLLDHVGDADIYRLTGRPSGPAPTLTVQFAPSPIVEKHGNLPGEFLVENDGTENRMLYTVARPSFMVEVRDTNGKLVGRREMTAPVHAVATPGRVVIPFSVPLNELPGSYRVTLAGNRLPAFQGSVSATVQIVDAGNLPRLTLAGQRIVSASVFVPGERVAVWVTLKNQTTIALPETMAGPGGAIDAVLPRSRATRAVSSRMAREAVLSYGYHPRPEERYAGRR